MAFYMGPNMSFGGPPPMYSVRPSPNLPVHLSAKYLDPSMPIELNGILTVNEWKQRYHEIHKTVRFYYWSICLRLYIIFGILTSIFLPAVLMSILGRSIIDHGDDVFIDGNRFVDPGEVAKFRGICFGIFIGTILLVWTPLFLFKFIGSKRVEKILSNYNANDAARGTMQSLTWSLRETSTFGQSAVINIKLPCQQSTSAFDPRIYLPPHLRNLATDYPDEKTAPAEGVQPTREMFDPFVDRA